MSAPAFWRLMTALFGAITLYVLLSFSLTQTVYSAADLGQAVSAFQRAEAGTRLSDLFASWDAVQAMQIVNIADLHFFIPAYAIFLISAAAMLAGGALRPLAWLAIVPALIGAGADAIETMKQLEVTRALEEATWRDATLPFAIAPMHWAKYFALGVNALAVSGLCLLGERRRYALAILALVPLPCVAAAYFELISPRVFAAALFVFWLTLFATAVTETVRAKGASA
jgi:hypothetical protein